MIKIIYLMITILLIILILKKIEQFDLINKQLKPYGFYLNKKNEYRKNINKKDRADLLLDNILN